MPLIQLNKIAFSVGGPLLLEDVNLALETGERMCVVGRNGAGKSTLLRLLAGEIQPDDGERRVQSGVRIARLAQEVPHDTTGSVFDVVAAGMGETGALLAEFHRLSHGDVAASAHAAALARVQARIEAVQGWDLERRVEQVLTRLELQADAAFAALSGGMKRRVLLAQALVGKPDVLLLDEPTNHLDIEAIAWLEDFLRTLDTCIVFVTHDRSFLRALATRILEIDRGRLTSWPGDYANFLRRREERWHAEAQADALFDKKLAQEEVWIRQGIKARRTRNEGRVRALEALRRERAARRERAGSVRMALASAPAPGRKVIETRGLNYAIGGRTLVRDLDATVFRGDRVGIIGSNGAGKTTLLRLLLGELVPDSGAVIHGTRLEIAYFDQHRNQLDESLTTLDNVAGGASFIERDGQRQHVLGYLQDFLFTPERARAPITRLSGGERNRLLLARLFARPSNLLVMDEPTNDLDVETLELLEERLADYAGTLLLVSHDRAFLDSVVSATLVLEGDGRVGDYVGGYSDWSRQRAAPPVVASPARVDKPIAVAAPSPPARRKLSYKDARELEQLPARIGALEARLAELAGTLNDPALYRREPEAALAVQAEIAAAQTALEAAYRRWEALEAQV